jgi:hypothetical protein
VRPGWDRTSSPLLQESAEDADAVVSGEEGWDAGDMGDPEAIEGDGVTGLPEVGWCGPAGVASLELHAVSHRRQMAAKKATRCTAMKIPRLAGGGVGPPASLGVQGP